MSDLRAAAQQALEAAENRLPLIGQAAIIDELNALGAAAEREAAAMTAKESLQRLGVDWAITEAVMKDIRARRTSTISLATLIDPRGSLGEPIV